MGTDLRVLTFRVPIFRAWGFEAWGFKSYGIDDPLLLSRASACPEPKLGLDLGCGSPGSKP